MEMKNVVVLMRNLVTMFAGPKVAPPSVDLADQIFFPV